MLLLLFNYIISFFMFEVKPISYITKNSYLTLVFNTENQI